MIEVVLAVTNVAVVLSAGVAVFAFWKAQKSANEVREIAIKIVLALIRWTKTERKIDD